MPLPFRQRIFVILGVLPAVPTTLAVIGWAVSLRGTSPSAGALASLETVGSSARTLTERLDTLRLTAPERAAVRAPLGHVSNAVSPARRADPHLRYYTAGVAVGVLAVGGVVVFAAPGVADHPSRP